MARIRRLYYAEHWRVGTIATELGVHHETVKGALALAGRVRAMRVVRASVLDPFLAFMREVLEGHPRLRATRLFVMLRERGCPASVRQVRRKVADLRPTRHEAFVRRRMFAGEEAQVDWASFGKVTVGGAERLLSLFVMTLSYSRAIFLEFFFDQTLASFLRGHVRAFASLGGVPRVLLYDNLRAAVSERRGAAVRFNPRLIELAAHYHFAPRACRPARGNEKGIVERSIRYVRDSFFAARPFTTLSDFNRQAREWREHIAHARPWASDDRQTVAEAWAEETPRLLPLPQHPFDTDEMVPVSSGKTIYVRFDKNDYSIPPACVGRLLTLVASDTRVRVLDGEQEVASHRRSWGRKEQIEDGAHVAAVLAQKQRARGSSRSARLIDAAPEAETFLDAAFARGELVAPLTEKLLLLLDDYGPRELRGAVQEALTKDTPRLSSVAYILAKRRRQAQSPRLAPVDLARRPDLKDLYVQPHSAQTYDALSHTDGHDD